MITLVVLAALASQPFALELRGGAPVLSGPESLRVYTVVDDDSLPPQQTDRWYSSAAQLGVRWSLAPERLWLPKDARALLSVSLGRSLYTPRSTSIVTKEALQGDRPYSGWMRASAGLDVLLPLAPLAFLRGAQPYTHLSLDVHGGAQTSWSNEVIQTQPGLTADASAFGETTLASLGGGGPSAYWTAGLSGHAGSMLLAWAAHTTVTGGWTGDPLGRAPLPFAAYGFARGEVRRVFQNATIDRPILDGTVVARHEPWVSELALGVVLRAWRLEASAGPVFRSHETATVWDGFRAGQLIWQASVSYVQ